MTLRSAALLAVAALAVSGAPALAQAGYDPGPPPPLPEIHDEQWEEEWDEQTDDGYYDADPDWIERERHSNAHDARPGEWRGHPDAGYPEQRAAWLRQCRAYYYDERGRRRGEAIGGVLGAVAGGIAGNRIADGARLGGTLIGAGVGGLAGAAIGGVLGADADRARIDECEAYLLHHEQSSRGYAHPGSGPDAVGYHYPYPYPVMWVKVPIHTVRRGDCGCETVVEEWIEEEPAPPPVRRVQRTKIQRIAPAPDKRVRTTK
jgi:hypothetical protein